MYIFEAATANDVWLEAARTVLSEGSFQPGRGGLTLELLHAAFQIDDPRQRWVFSRRPAMNPAFALAEVIWIINGHDDSPFLNFWNRRLPHFAGPSQIYHGAYGARIRNWRGTDQLDRVAKVLGAKPDSRQAVLQIWDPSRDLPDQLGEPANTDIPCNIGATLKVRDGKLQWLQVIRSNDLFLGVPHNFVQFTMLQEILAGWLGVEVGPYTQVSDSLHVYERDLTNMSQSVEPVAAPSSPSIALPRSVSEAAFRRLDDAARVMTRTELSREQIRELIDQFDGPAEFDDWLRILGAEAARRRGWSDAEEEIARSIKSPVFALLWRQWHARVTRESDERSTSESISIAEGELV